MLRARSEFGVNGSLGSSGQAYSGMIIGMCLGRVGLSGVLGAAVSSDNKDTAESEKLGIKLGNKSWLNRRLGRKRRGGLVGESLLEPCD
jgi:hypothetical protein